MDRLDVPLHILLNLVVGEILETAVVQRLRLLRSLQYDAFAPERSPSLGLSFNGAIPIHTAVKALVDGLVSTASFLLGLEQVLLVAVDVENIDDRVCSAHEIGVVRVDVAVLYLNQGSHHVGGGGQLLAQKLDHDFHNLFPQILEPVQLRHLDLIDNCAQLFVD